jgi:hypothetical protein
MTNVHKKYTEMEKCRSILNLLDIGGEVIQSIVHIFLKDNLPYVYFVSHIWY